MLGLTGGEEGQGAEGEDVGGAGEGRGGGLGHMGASSEGGL